MSVQPNHILGAVGLVIALVTGAVIAADWRNLSDLRSYEASFETRIVPLADRTASVASGQEAHEAYAVAGGNVTRWILDVTWTDPLLDPPELHVQLLDPAGRVRAEERHTGGASGIHLEVPILAGSMVPDGRYGFSSRPAEVKKQFEQRWPAHPESAGTWTLVVSNPAPPPQGTASTATYHVRATYESYAGTLRAILEAPR